MSPPARGKKFKLEADRLQVRGLGPPAHARPPLQPPSGRGRRGRALSPACGSRGAARELLEASASDGPGGDLRIYCLRSQPVYTGLYHNPPPPPL